MKIRQGRKVGRTLYEQAGPEPSDQDELIGVMDTVLLAAMVVAAVNGPPPTAGPSSELWQQWAGRTLADWADQGAPCSMCPAPPEGMQVSLRCGEHLGVAGTP